MKPYDEEFELNRYVWNECAHYLSEFEASVGRAALMRMKADQATSKAIADRIRERWARLDDAAVNEALSGGWDAYRESVRRRILLENAKEIIVNRCPECLRVARTPKAKQCLWCGHDWHANKDGQLPD